MVDRDHPMRAHDQRRLDREQPHRPAAPNRDRVSGFDVRILGGHPAGRQNIGQKQHLVIFQVIGDGDRTDVGVRHAHILGLAAGVAAGEVRVAERRPHRMAHQQS